MQTNNFFQRVKNNLPILVTTLSRYLRIEEFSADLLQHLRFVFFREIQRILERIARARSRERNYLQKRLTKVRVWLKINSTDWKRKIHPCFKHPSPRSSISEPRLEILAPLLPDKTRRFSTNAREENRFLDWSWEFLKNGQNRFHDRSHEFLRNVETHAASAKVQVTHLAFRRSLCLSIVYRFIDLW